MRTDETQLPRGQPPFVLSRPGASAPAFGSIRPPNIPLPSSRHQLPLSTSAQQDSRRGDEDASYCHPRNSTDNSARIDSPAGLAFSCNDSSEGTFNHSSAEPYSLDPNVKRISSQYLIQCYHEFKSKGKIGPHLTAPILSLAPVPPDERRPADQSGDSTSKSFGAPASRTFPNTFSEDGSSAPSMRTSEAPAGGRGRGRGGGHPTECLPSSGRVRGSRPPAIYSALERRTEESVGGDGIGPRTGDVRPPPRTGLNHHQESVPLWRRKDRSGSDGVEPQLASVATAAVVTSDVPAAKPTAAVEPCQAGFLLGRSDSARISSGLPGLSSLSGISTPPIAKPVSTVGPRARPKPAPVEEDKPAFKTSTSGDHFYQTPQPGKFGVRDPNWVEDDWGTVRGGPIGSSPPRPSSRDEEVQSRALSKGEDDKNRWRSEQQEMEARKQQPVIGWTGDERHTPSNSSFWDASPVVHKKHPNESRNEDSQNTLNFPEPCEPHPVLRPNENYAALLQRNPLPDRLATTDELLAKLIHHPSSTPPSSIPTPSAYIDPLIESLMSGRPPIAQQHAWPGSDSDRAIIDQIIGRVVGRPQYDVPAYPGLAPESGSLLQARLEAALQSCLSNRSSSLIGQTSPSSLQRMMREKLSRAYTDSNYRSTEPFIPPPDQYEPELSFDGLLQPRRAPVLDRLSDVLSDKPNLYGIRDPHLRQQTQPRINYDQSELFQHQNQLPDWQGRFPDRHSDSLRPAAEPKIGSPGDKPSLADHVWEYCDPKGQIQGQFSSIQMQTWYEGNFFPGDLLMRYNRDLPWVKFRDLFPLKLADVFPPFSGFPSVHPDGSVTHLNQHPNSQHVPELRGWNDQLERPTSSALPPERPPVETRTIEARVMGARKTEPVKAEPVKVEPVKAEPIKAEPIKAEPVKVEPVKVELVKTELLKTEPIKPEPIKIEPITAEPIIAEPIIAQSRTHHDDGWESPPSSSRAELMTSDLKSILGLPMQSDSFQPLRKSPPPLTSSPVSKPLDGFVERRPMLPVEPKEPVPDLMEVMQEEEKASRLKLQEESSHQDDDSSSRGKAAWKVTQKAGGAAGGAAAVFDESDFPDPSSLFQSKVSTLSSTRGKLPKAELPPISKALKKPLVEFFKTDAKPQPLKSAWGRSTQSSSADPDVKCEVFEVPQQSYEKPVVVQKSIEPEPTPEPTSDTIADCVPVWKKKATAVPSTTKSELSSPSSSAVLSNEELTEIRKLMKACMINLDDQMIQFLKGCKTADEIVDILQDSLEDRTHLRLFATEFVNPFRTVSYAKGAGTSSKQVVPTAPRLLTASKPATSSVTAPPVAPVARHAPVAPKRAPTAPKQSDAPRTTKATPSISGSSTGGDPPISESIIGEPEPKAKASAVKRSKKGGKGKAVDPSLLAKRTNLFGCPAPYKHAQYIKPHQMSTKRNPSDFLKQVIGRSVVVRLNDGADYKGLLACLDDRMNIAMEQVEEVIDGTVANRYNDAFIRGNNVLYISAASSKPSPEDKS